MKINDVEQLLSISKANIRFYEKQGLLSPARSSNGYRDYSDADILRLKEIIILRKLGICVDDIESIHNGQLSLQEVFSANIADLEVEIEGLNGALELSIMIQAEEAEELDIERYWNLIREEEEKGNKFYAVAVEYWDTVGPEFYKRFFINANDSLKNKIAGIVLFCTIYGIWATYILDAGTYWQNFFHWPIVFAFVFCITFPLHLIGKRFPRVAAFFCNLLLIICLGILALVGILIVGGFLNSLFHFYTPS